ncbi:MAG: metal ABC transporter substrate-binding protein [Mariprofundaceae bacterium]|nr:metal ABC transporter substrate-binding protein [Mariprofundaceae bacterium]
MHITPLPCSADAYRSKRFRYFFPYLMGLLLYAITPNTAYAVIVATLPPLAGLVSMLDAKADVHCLLPPGADAHSFQLTPRQVRQLKQADLLIRASRDDGNWPGLSIPARQLDLWPKKDHAWLLPSEVRRVLPALAKKLQDMAPDRRQTIEQSLKRALHVCDKLEIAWKQALAPFQQRGVIMQHPAWRRLCEYFGVHVWAVLEPRHHGSIRPRQLEHALELLHAHPDAILWGNAHHSSQGLLWLSRHGNGKPVINFDALGLCGAAWLQLMHLNLKRLPS